MNEKTCTIRLPVSIYWGSAVLLLPSLLQSTYLKEAWTVFLTMALVYFGLLMLVWKVCQNTGQVLTAAASAGIGLSNIFQSMKYYACGEGMTESDLSCRHTLLVICGIHLSGVLITWGMLMLLEYLENKHPKILLALCMAAVGGILGLVWLLGSSENTSTVLGGIQPAIPAMFLGLVLFARSCGKCKTAHKVTCRVLLIAMLLFFCLKNEMGIPFYILLICAVFYLLIYPKASLPNVLRIALHLPLAAVGALLMKLCLTETWSKMYTSFMTKLQSRSGNIPEQILNARFLLYTADVFGRFSYDGRLSASSTDLALVNSIHYGGFLWFFCMTFCLLAGCWLILRDETIPHGLGLPVMLRGLCTCGILCTFMYTTLQMVGTVPIIGIQPFFIGTSKGFAFLSAAMLGCVCYDSSFPKRLTALKNKITTFI